LELIPCLKLYNCITEMTAGNLARKAFVNTRPRLTRFGNRKVSTLAIAVVMNVYVPYERMPWFDPTFQGEFTRVC
jgi:hypothetical protein